MFFVLFYLCFLCYLFESINWTKSAETVFSKKISSSVSSTELKGILELS